MKFNTVAPTRFFYAPKNTWVLAYQWSRDKFNYRTSNDPANMYGWSAEVPFFTGNIANFNTGPIGQALIGDDTHILFEAIEVCNVKSQDQRLMIIESIGSGGRYFRSYTASRLDGTWTPQATTENQANTDAGASWTNDISHGDIIRSNPDQTFEIGPWNQDDPFRIVGEHEAIAKITGTTICGSNIHLMHRVVFQVEKGGILGHEF
ncbi:hypothetical protein N0V88_008049 [Collariella sp. IMI 366227]|nr:hypothetical protein N0V88_008049 [Collariella sp. IMI 366227]